MKPPILGLVGIAAAMALSGCASSIRHNPNEQPRLATVIEWRDPDSTENKVWTGIAAGQFSVFSSVLAHLNGGGTPSPESIGPAVPGIVDNTRAAVSDACAHTMLVEFDDNKTRMMLHMTCDKTFTVGQRVSVVRNKAAGLDYRNLMIVQPVP